MEAEFLTTPTANSALFGARSGTSNEYWVFYHLSSKGYIIRTGSGSNTPVITANTPRKMSVETDGNKLTVNGTTVSAAASSFTVEYPMYLFAVNNAGDVQYPASMRLYFCRIYSGDVLIRDYIPCADAAGTAGLWDKVNGVFYANSGSGVFAPGEEVHRAPDAPSNLMAEVVGTDVLLKWDADENADGYRIYHGSELIGETDDAQYQLLELEKYTVHVYSAAAYNENGEGDLSSVSFYVDGSNRPLSDLITDRTAADVTMRRKKGSYNASDLNRVSAAAEYVRALIRALGYTLPDGNDRVWLESDIPDIPGLADHHSAVLGLDVIGYAREKLRLPGSLVHLTYTDANMIERFLLEIGEAAERIPKTYIYSGEIYGGEND
jgi:hypothetical protein